MAVTASMVKELRETSGAGMLDCKKALVESDGNLEAAIDWLRQKGLSKAAKKSSRVAAEGLVAYAVDGTKGAVIELNSETDFVAKNEEFIALARDIAMHAAASNAKYVTRDEVDEAALEAAKAVFAEEVKDKPADMQEKILEGKRRELKLKAKQAASAKTGGGGGGGG